jgi:hypothetical protein
MISKFHFCLLFVPLFSTLEHGYLDAVPASAVIFLPNIFTHGMGELHPSTMPCLLWLWRCRTQPQDQTGNGKKEDRGRDFTERFSASCDSTCFRLFVFGFVGC